MTAGVVITVAASSLVCEAAGEAGQKWPQGTPNRQRVPAARRTSTTNWGGLPLEAGSGDCAEAQKQDGGWHWAAGQTAGQGERRREGGGGWRRRVVARLVVAGRRHQLRGLP